MPPRREEADRTSLRNAAGDHIDHVRTRYDYERQRDPSKQYQPSIYEHAKTSSVKTGSVRLRSQLESIYLRQCRQIYRPQTTHHREVG